MGHEVRSFTDNSDKKEYWLIDKSQSLMPAYQKIIGQEVADYQPIHARLQVKDIGKIEDGFGAEYDGGYEVKKIISIQKEEDSNQNSCILKRCDCIFLPKNSFFRSGLSPAPDMQEHNNRM